MTAGELIDYLNEQCGRETEVVMLTWVGEPVPRPFHLTWGKLRDKDVVVILGEEPAEVKLDREVG